MPGGRLLAAGRDCDVYEHGAGAVLRRSRRERSLAGEAAVMDHARAHGFPVPAVLDVLEDGRAMVLERVDGPNMLQAMLRRPWTVPRGAAALAELHDRLHRIPAPEGAPGVGLPGDRLLHLDLHPLNVLLGPHGPVVIDWTNAGAGDPGVDVALTWIVVAVSETDGGRVERVATSAFRVVFLRSFLARADRAGAARCLRHTAELRSLDPNLRDGERTALWRLVDEVEASEGGGPSA